VGGKHWELCDTLRALRLPADVADANLMFGARREQLFLAVATSYQRLQTISEAISK